MKHLLLSFLVFFSSQSFASEKNMIKWFDEQNSGLQNRTCGEFLITYAVDRSRLVNKISNNQDSKNEKLKSREIALNSSILLLYTEALTENEKKMGKMMGRAMATKDSYMLETIFTKCMAIPNSWIKEKSIPESHLKELEKITDSLIEKIY